MGQISIRRFVTLEPIYNSTDYFRRLWQKRRYEIVSYNNCFYRNQFQSNYIVPLDIDELIVPKQTYSWKQFLKHINSTGIEEKYASLTVPNTYYFTKSDDQNSVFFLENIFRSSYSPNGESGKSFIISKNALTVFNHYSLHTLKPDNIRAYFISPHYVQLNHYKRSCNPVVLPECNRYISSHKIKDPIMMKFKDKFLQQYTNTLYQLKQLNILL